MICPYCSSADHRVIESRVPEAKDAVRRRRECADCGQRFTTYERTEERPLTVIKASGARQPFDRTKLFEGLQRACHKRRVTAAELERAARDIEMQLRNQLTNEVPSALIGDLALRRLKSLDQVAYVRFASVYRQFAGVDEFAEELARLEYEPPLTALQSSFDEHMFGTIAEGADPVGRRLTAVPGGRTATAVRLDPTHRKETPDGD